MDSEKDHDPWEKLLRHSDYDVTVSELNIHVKDNVFTPDPSITYSTMSLLERVPDVSGKDVLDMGCGTGVVGIYCVKHGARSAVFSDVSNDAITNTHINVKRHSVSSQSRVIQSDLFDSVDGTFDYMFANLPILDSVWDTHDLPHNLIYRFLKESKAYLNPGGKVFLAWASFSDISPVKNILNDLDYNYEIFEKEVLCYTWYVFEIS